MQASARARLFVLFLDTYHVEIAGSHNIRRPLVDALDRVIGPDDLVGVMTPDMSPTDIAFARKTTTIDGFLTRYWNWGERDQIRHPEPEDQEYAACYPNSADGSCADQNGIAAEMIDRRHEKRTLDALVDLARFLRGAREERKAILAITDGWLLFDADQSLTRPLSCQGVPGPAAYGRGGVEATTTDANIALGRINKDYFFGGEITADMGAVEAALGRIAQKLGVSPAEAARGIVRIAIAKTS